MSKVKKAIVKIPRYFLRKCGFDIVHFVPKIDAIALRRNYAIQSNQVNVLLDVGADVGNFAFEIRNAGFCGRIISFEPLSASFNMLKQKAELDENWRCENIAIGDYDGMIDMNISGRSTSSSLLPMSVNHVKVAPDSAYVSMESVQVSRLDSLLPELFGGDSRIYLKLDVQGYEKGVLQGAQETLKQTYVIEIELSMVPLYEGSMLYRQMIGYLEDLGYRLVSWEDVLIDSNSKYALQADAIFVRNTAK